MEGSKAHIIEQLRRDILPLQGHKPVSGGKSIDLQLGPMLQAFPQNRFPEGAVHECIMDSQESRAATAGFVAALLGGLMKTKGVCLWIGNSQMIYPPALVEFNVQPGNVIFINLKKDKEILWAAEEALRCEALTSVVAEVQSLSFTASRRLQLAVEKSRVTGFILRKHNVPQLSTTACICRWRITSCTSLYPEQFPGVGFPRWNVELLRVRNGHTGEWMISWYNGSFEHQYKELSLVPQKKKNVG